VLPGSRRGPVAIFFRPFFVSVRETDHGRWPCTTRAADLKQTLRVTSAAHFEMTMMVVMMMMMMMMMVVMIMLRLKFELPRRAYFSARGHLEVVLPWISICTGLYERLE
jgi:hypothetical protein